MGELHITWEQMFTRTQEYDPCQSIGRYFVRYFDKEERLRSLSFCLFAPFCRPLLDPPTEMGFAMSLDRYEMEQGYHLYRGVLRDLWSLPTHDDETPYETLTAGRLLWFLHCFELVQPTLFEGPSEVQWRNIRKWAESLPESSTAEDQELASLFSRRLA